ncbi:isochorismate synthase [Dictyobacter aurantiacus]|uniref:isochorismate synthase n=1 Tax=Dictyobacter aurantiacus TaxID=1936993 RepID=A0A401ZAP8_9CHLR|nr:isochorismate synthase [Dictyobacter aurantiacus]GCE03919.1 isochorismate synthase [Dictyobacter aurantiacus]
MDITFTDNAYNTKHAGSPLYDRDHLLTTFQQARERASQLERQILVSITLPMTAHDPQVVFRMFQHLDLGNRFFWARAADKRALVGIGEATVIETAGPERVTTAATAWRELRQHAIIEKISSDLPPYTSGPVLLGGFMFDTLTPHTDLWEGFPDGLLILPHLLFHADEDKAALTINALIDADDDVEQRTDRVVETVRCLAQALQSGIDQPVEEAAQRSGEMRTQDILPAERWKEQVAQAVKKIRAGAFEKVVLARGVQVEQEEKFDIDGTLRRLSQSYPSAYVFAIQRGTRYFMGATPERLVCSEDGEIQTMALAGSAPRGTSEEEDRRFGEELLKSEKNQGEHNFVVTTIRDALSSLCSRVWVADAPRLLKLKNIQHLETPIMGNLKPGHSILEAIEDLHPTPAVGGYPRLPALDAIREDEQLDRGWYAGPIGWIGTGGNGEFAVALRSGLVDGKRATLFAGCGIVADSDPESEYQESCLKLQVMLRGLGGEL